MKTNKMDVDLTRILKKKMGSYPRVRGRYNSSEMYFINHGRGKFKTTPEKWLHPEEKDMKQILMMWNGIGTHNQIQTLLGGKDYKEAKVEFAYKDIILVAKADFLPPHKADEVWELKTSEKLMDEMKPWHEHQVKVYCTLFGKQIGMVYQPLQNADGLYLKAIGRVERDDAWFNSEMERLYQFHLEVEKLWAQGSINRV